MPSFNNNGFRSLQTPAERKAAARAARERLTAHIASLGRDAKVQTMATAIAGAFVARQTVTEHDLAQAGFSAADIKDKALYDRAFELARGIEPALSGLAA